MNDFGFYPQAGSQVQLIACPLREALYHGPRGNGKTIMLLMDFLQHVGQGFGADWRGILFRETFPQLEDVISKTRKWFPLLHPSAVYNKADYSWEFEDGEKLLLRHMRVPDDYWDYHGHEYCVGADTLVLTPSGYTPIHRLRVGDAVMTPNGPDRVSRTFAPSEKECVKASFFSASGRLIAEQVQSVNHRLLTIDNMPDLMSSEWSRNERQSALSSWSWKDYRSLAGAGQETRAEPVYGTGGKNSNIDAEGKRQGRWQRHESSGIFLPQREPLALSGGYGQRLPILSRAYGKYNAQGWGSHQLDQFLLRGLAQGLVSVLSAGDRFVSSASADAQYLTGKDASFLSGYRPSSHLYDGQPRSRLAFAPGGAPSLSGAGVRTYSGLLLGGWEPFLKGSQISSGKSFRNHYEVGPLVDPGRLGVARVVLRPCGVRSTVDVSVETNKQYVTKGGVVNSNCWIGWEELTNWATGECYQMMKACNRSSAPGMPRKYRATCNPWGAGHGWVKSYFIDPAKAGAIYQDKENGWQRTHIKGDISENKILTAADPEYLNTLDGIEDENLKKAWRFGDWDIAAGGIFTDVYDPTKHVIPPFKIPDNWEITRSFDWGSSRPFSVGWWAQANGERVDGVRQFAKGTWIRIDEWYGWNGKPNEGCRMLAAEIAKGIKEREKERGWNVTGGVADSAIFDVGSGLSRESIASEMASLGVRWTPANKGPGSRVQGWEKVRELFVNARKTPMESPGLVVFDICRQFIRTMPTLLRDEKKPDDIDTRAEDHVADEVRYRLTTNIPKAGAVSY